MTTIKDKTIFITGGAGFIGSTIIGRLVEDNQIVVYDNLFRDSLKDKPFSGHPNLRLVQGDVLDFESLSKAMAGADIVVHCAAIAGIDTVIISPVTTMRVNMVGSPTFSRPPRACPAATGSSASRPARSSGSRPFVPRRRTTP